jgi:hypothetical protein
VQRVALSGETRRAPSAGMSLASLTLGFLHRPRDHLAEAEAQGEIVVNLGLKGDRDGRRSPAAPQREVGGADANRPQVGAFLPPFLFHGLK